MSPANALLGASRRLARALPYRPFELRMEHPVVGFTFDDFPASAAEHAAPLLEDVGARGTFYFADGLADGYENGQLIASCAAVSELAARGHDIGAHTRGHIDVQRTHTTDLIVDVAANTSAIATLSGQVPASFAYPFGVVSMRSKAVLASRYAGLRGITSGINRGLIDLAHLHAQELYDVSSTLDSMEELLDDLERRGGWLIFYTHDVREHPSDIGCSPAYFGAVLDLVHRRGIAIETVAQTLTQLGVAR
jgi:peptidoglycan/xylan/chitin deacetylase (PgdA/CDA1 family)